MTWTEPEKKFKPWVNVPEGPHLATCIDVIDLGVPDYTVKPDNPMGTPKVAIVFHVKVTDDNGNPVEHPDNQAWTVRQTFSAFFGPKAFLRKYVEGWIGAVPKNEKGYAIFDEESLIGRDAYITVKWSEPKKNARGETVVYANAETASKPLPGMKGPGPVPDYVRVKDRPTKPQWQKKETPNLDPDGIGF